MPGESAKEGHENLDLLTARNLLNGFLVRGEELALLSGNVGSLCEV
jgi:hypothetical protein